MKFEDSSQNLRRRLWFVQIFVVLLLALLGVRLYYLQLVRGHTTPRSLRISASDCCR